MVKSKSRDFSSRNDDEVTDSKRRFALTAGRRVATDKNQSGGKCWGLRQPSPNIPVSVRPD